MALGGAIESFYFALIKNCQFNLTPLMADPQSAMEEAKVDWKVSPSSRSWAGSD